MEYLEGIFFKYGLADGVAPELFRDLISGEDLALAVVVQLFDGDLVIGVGFFLQDFHVVFQVDLREGGGDGRGVQREMNTGEVLSGGIESDGVDGHFFSQLKCAKASYSLTVLFYVGADEKDRMLKFGNGYALAIVCQLDAGEGSIMKRAVRIVDDEVDAGGFCLQRSVEQLANVRESVTVPGEQLFYYPGVGG